MTELTVPPKADEAEAGELIAEFVEYGDIVKVRSEATAADDRTVVEGEVTGLRTQESGPNYLELDERPLGAGSIAYSDIDTIVRRVDDTSPT
ncbi:hypothetical protein OB905_05330 [Halobacteria archaeon AArc-dxtr1]|nr:hypothetical protein [Halobacteria archaeon AArc-dxtr1]